MYYSTKKYDHNAGFSCCFRQWRAKSHCRVPHGYALAFKFVFAAETLDENNWVMDFGGLHPVKTFLENWFDHTTLVANDDPELAWFQQAANRGILDLRIVPATGCEGFASFVYWWVNDWLISGGHGARVQLKSVEVSEHSGNSAIFER